MTTQQQEQRLSKLLIKSRRRRAFSQRTLFIVTISIIAIAVATIWILGSLKIIPDSWASISSIIIAVLGVVFTVLQAIHVFLPPDKHVTAKSLTQTSTNSSIPAALPPSTQIPPIIVQLPTTQPDSTQSHSLNKTSHRGIVGLPPPTDPRTIQQREHVVKAVYTKIIRPDISAIALTGIGGVGKSTLAALIYRYAEEQRHACASGFLAETLWLAIDPAVTFADLAGNLFEAMGKPLPDLSNLAPQNQAIVLFNALNTTDEPRLIILDQFENLLNWDTGHALTDRPGVGEWLDIINSQQCACHILLTSRPRPVGTREYPPTYLQEYPVVGLEMNEGISLLRSQGVQGTETEIQTAVSHCAGHAFSLTLLASLMRDHHMSLNTLFKNSELWTGDIATNLLDHIYTQRLNDIQREVLLAFSLYREPVPLEAAQAVTSKVPKRQVSFALRTLLIQHLVEAVGEGCYQLHAIVAHYAQSHFDKSNEEPDEEALRTAHARAAQYYWHQASKSCPPREKRRRISDVHDLIEAVWQLCQAEGWQQAFNIMEQEAIFPDLNRWGGNAILLDLYQLLLPIDKWHPVRSQEARIYSNLGEVCRVLGQLERAREYFERALHINIEIDNRNGEGWSHHNIGRVYGELGKIGQAGKYHETALRIFKEVGDLEGEGIALNDLGWVCYILGQLELAQQYYDRALSIRKDVGDRLGEAMTLNNLGRVYRVLGQIERAQSNYEQALTINREEGDRLGEGWTLHNLGKLYNDLGQNVQARECLEKALRIRREIGNRRGEGATLSTIGRVYLSIGDTEQAWKYYEEAFRISKEVEDIRAEGFSLNNLGKVCSILGQKEQAIKYFKQALTIRRKVEDRWGEARSLYHIGAFYLEQHQYEIALSCFLLNDYFLDEVQHPYHDEAHRWIEKIRQEVGGEHFTAVLAKVKPQAQNIIDQALQEEVQ